MGFFSKLFAPKTKIFFEIEGIGLFERVFSKRNQHTWKTEQNGLLITIRGSEQKPDNAQANFVKVIDAEIARLNNTINKKFRREFSEANLPVDFNEWKERFKIVAADVMMIHQGTAYWNITFEDLRSPYYHFTLYVEGNKATDFSIDS